MDREQLVEAMAEELWQSESARATDRRRLVPWSEAGEPIREGWRFMARAALAVAEPAVRAGERDEIIALIEATPTPGEADDTESGHRYAAGYRDASNCAADDLRRLRDRVVARTGGTP